MKKGFFSNLQHDLPAAVVVFLVALPLCLGIALASGAPLFSGIIAGIIGGTIVAIISGSRLGVSGPAAGLAVIVLNAIQELGSFPVFLFVVVVAGVIQLTFGLLKAGVIGYYFPTSVIKGMLSGIGIIIFLKQIPHGFGYDADPEGDWNFNQPDGQTTISELSHMLDYITPGALVITLVSLAILILWEQKFMKGIKLFKYIQGPLVAVLAGIGLTIAFSDSATWSLAAEHLVSIPVSDSIPGFFEQFTFPDFSRWGEVNLYILALTIAVVASLETLLCVEATDKLDPEKHVTPTNRELIAQGAGNIVSGFIGGLPITQVIVRSSANIQSGGKSRASAFFHGILLLVSAMSIPALLNLIPLASLAAILLVVGYKLAKPSIFREMYAKGWTEFIPYIITIVGIVFTDLLTGIGMGMAVAIIQILWKNYSVPYHFDYHDYKDGEPVVIELSEDVSFLNKASILNTLNHIPDGAKVIIDETKTRNMHPDVVEIIEDFLANAPTRNIDAEVRKSERIRSADPLKSFKSALPKDNP